MSASDVHVDADWLQARLGDPKVVLVEVHEDISVCDKGHIQGAVTLDWTKDLQRPALRDFADQAGFEALLSERGIANDDTVILYSGSCWLAVYTYWYFKHYGHDSVKLLEGARKKWELGARELVTEVPRRPRTAYRVQDTPGQRAIHRSRALTQRLGNGIVRPVNQVLRAVSARVLAAVNDHEDDAQCGRFRSIDGRAHRIARAKEPAAASPTGFGPVIYSLIETILQADEEVRPMSRSDVLVDADWVQAHLDDPGVVLVEVDEDTTAYDKDHIHSAVKLDWKKDLQDPVKRDFIGRAGFEALLSERGIANDDTVILYGGNNNWFAAYAYWYFKIYGHRDIKLLDGGRKKWELDSRELATEVPHRPATTYRAQEQDTSIRAYRDEVVTTIGQQNLVDVRSPDEFAGRLLAPAHLPQEQAQRAGHIPTATNVPWSKAANDDGTFKTDQALRGLYADAGLDFGKDTIAYCRIGERSAHTWFVLHELLGQPNVKNYDGSWTEYGSLVGVPVEVGDR